MGVLDFLRPKKMPPPKIEGIFKLPPASVSMGGLGVEPTGKAGVCFRSIGGQGFESMKFGIEKVLENKAFSALYKVARDEYGFTWVVMDCSALADAVASVYLASQLLIEGGFGQHILVAIFRFEKGTAPVYWIYNYRRVSFYPFAPRESRDRDALLEYRLRLAVMDELPVDSLDYWFPVWGIPF